MEAGAGRVRPESHRRGGGGGRVVAGIYPHPAILPEADFLRGGTNVSSNCARFGTV